MAANQEKQQGPSTHDPDRFQQQQLGLQPEATANVQIPPVAERIPQAENAQDATRAPVNGGSWVTRKTDAAYQRGMRDAEAACQRRIAQSETAIKRRIREIIQG